MTFAVPLSGIPSGSQAQPSIHENFKKGGGRGGKGQDSLACFVWFPLLLLIEDSPRNMNTFLCLAQVRVAVGAGLNSNSDPTDVIGRANPFSLSLSVPIWERWRKALQHSSQ